MNFPPPDFEGKIHAPESLLHAVHALPRPLVFTNGVFDVLHRGHVTYLAQARAQGASLVVALNTDASTRRLGKGSDRPINRLEDRAAVIAALGAADAVTWFDDDTPLATDDSNSIPSGQFGPVTGDVIALSPPLIVEKDHIDRLVNILADTIRATA